MRIDELRLIAYGCFTDLTLDFSQETGKVTIIYGDNEAGKSTARNAIAGLLYGMRSQKGIDFLHPTSKLRVAARLVGAQRSEPDHLVRKRGNGENTVARVGTDPEVWDAAGEMAALLGGIDEPTFKLLFGLDFASLRQGGEELLAGRGDLGQALFEGITGLANTREMLRSLETDANALLPRTGKGEIRLLNERAATLQREAQQQQVTARMISDLEGEVESRRQFAEETTRDRDALRAEIALLERVVHSYSAASDRQQALQELALLGDVRSLPSNCRELREAATRDRAHSEANLRSQEALKQHIEEQLVQATANLGALDQAVAIDGLVARIQQVEDARRDLPNMTIEAAEARRRVESMLAQSYPGRTVETARELLVAESATTAIEALAEAHDRLVQTRDENARHARDQRQIVDLLTVRLNRLPDREDPIVLRAAVQQGAARTHHVADQKRAEQSRDSKLAAAQTLLATTRLMPASLEEAGALVPPMVPTVQRYQQQAAEADAAVAACTATLTAAGERIQQTEEALARLDATSDAPTGEDLGGLRSARDAGWLSIRQALVAGQPLDLPPAEAADAYEGQVVEADRAADAMLAKADAVGRRAQLAENLANARKEAATARESLDHATTAVADLRERWTREWVGVVTAPLSPAEMLAWLSALAQIRDLLAQAAIFDAEATGHAQALDQARSTLLVAMGGLGGSVDASAGFETVLGAGQACLEQIENARQAHKDAVAALRAAEDQLKLYVAREGDAAADLRNWQALWTPTVQCLQLGDSPGVSQVRGVLAGLVRLGGDLDALAAANKHIRQMTSDLDDFELRVPQVAAPVLPDADRLGDSVEVVKRLRAALIRARQDEARASTLRSQLDALEVAIREAEAALKTAEGTLRGLMAEARVANLAELQEAEKVWSDHARLVADVARADAVLRSRAGDASVSDWADQVLAHSATEAQATLSALASALVEAESRERDAQIALGEALRARRAVDDGTSTLDKVQERQQVLAAIRRQADRFTALSIAAEALKLALETTRDTAQGPMLREAGRLFSRMTRGSFSGLAVDLDPREREVIVGRRTSSLVTVDQMSDGTRDQLFLSLRLAALGLRRDAEPMPLILDDVLVHFDDERATATLDVLAEVAQTRQVLFFTHHQRMLELAEKAGIPFGMHRLERSA